MLEIGTDLVLVSRMEKSLEIPGFAEKVFSEPERAYCKTTESFAGIFAAKEAYYKALGTGLQLPLNALTVLHDDRGKCIWQHIFPHDPSVRCSCRPCCLYIFCIPHSDDGGTCHSGKCCYIS